MYGNIPYHPRD